jgi:hypothetical protein
VRLVHHADPVAAEQRRDSVLLQLPSDQRFHRRHSWRDDITPVRAPSPFVERRVGRNWTATLAK